MGSGKEEKKGGSPPPSARRGGKSPTGFTNRRRSPARVAENGDASFYLWVYKRGEGKCYVGKGDTRGGGRVAWC